MKRWTLLTALSIAVVAAAACSNDEPAPTSAPLPMVETSTPTGDGSGPQPPTGSLDTSKTYTATFELVKGDEFDILLYDDLVPTIVENFVNLAESGFYDGITFHRVIANFMAQGGDPTGTGAGDPGYKFADEFHVDARHDKPGILSMANSGYNSNGSQFFITFVETPFLDAFDDNDQPKNCASFSVSCHAVFGEVVSGMDVVNNIRVRDPGTDSNPGDAIKTIHIEEN
jgi:peptidyl-prolyl cis-trans isomerase B (cyclophilin B)